MILRIAYSLVFFLVFMQGFAQLTTLNFYPIGDRTLSGPPTQTLGYRFESAGNNLIAPAVNHSISISGTANVDYMAGREIVLKPGFTATNFTGGGGFHGWIEPSIMDVVWIYPQGTPGTVGDHEKLEIGFNLTNELDQKIRNFLSNLPGDKLNPFDPEQVDVYAEFTSPEGIVIRQNAFYYERHKTVPINGELLPDFNNPVSTGEERYDILKKAYRPALDESDNYRWRLRFAPPIVGNWSCNIKVNGFSSFYRFDFDVAPSSNQGYLKVGEDGIHLQFNKTNNYFTGVGLNISWPNPAGWWDPLTDQWPLYLEDNTNTRTPLGFFREHLNYFKIMKGNTARLVFGQCDFDPEWEKLGNYQKSQPYLMYMDSILDICNEREIRLVICQQHHGNLQNQRDGLEAFQLQWNLHPYKYGVKGNIELPGITTPQEFITSEEAKSFYKKRLRYMMARWGYSTNIATWQILSETENVGKEDHLSGHPEGFIYPRPYYTDPTFRYNLNHWQVEMADYLKNTLKTPQLIGASFGSSAWPDDVSSTPLAGNGQLSEIERLSGKFSLFNHPLIEMMDVHPYFNDMLDNVRVAVETSRMFMGKEDHTELHNLPQVNDSAPGIQKPYFGGEVGAPDYKCIEECYSELVNRGYIWSSFFSGSWCTALQWTHETILGNYGKPVRHDNIYTNMLNFLGTIDFSELYFPEIIIDITNSEKTNINEYYMLKSNDRKKIYGWAHNRNRYWFNIEQNNPQCPFASDPTFGCNGKKPNGQPYLTTEEDWDGYSYDEGHNNPIIVKGFHIVFGMFLKRYDANFYSTQTDSPTWLASRTNRRIDIDGKLRIHIPDPLFNLNDPDAAFSIIRNDAQRISEDSTIHSITIEEDTLSLCFDTGLAIEGYDSSYTYRWIINDSLYSSSPNPFISFDTSGTYIVQVIFEHEVINDTIFQKWVVMDCPESNYASRIGRKNYADSINIPLHDKHFIIYPNPATVTFSLQCNFIEDIDFNVDVLSLAGNSIVRAKWKGDSVREFSTNKISKGLYIVVIYDKNNVLLDRLKLIIL